MLDGNGKIKITYQRVIKKVAVSCDGHVNIYLQWYLHLLAYVNLGDAKFECGDPNLVQYLQYLDVTQEKYGFFCSSLRTIVGVIHPRLK